MKKNLLNQPRKTFCPATCPMKELEAAIKTSPSFGIKKFLEGVRYARIVIEGKQR